jgi:ABC-type transporter Mla MlaB component
VQFKAEVDDHGDHRVIRLSGALRSEMSSVLTKLVDECQPPVQLDLADLLSVDAAGLRTLASLEARGAELVGASPYVSLQLQGARAPVIHARNKEDR